MTAIVELARSRGVPVVEDSCEALGGVSDGAPAGTRGDAGVFAFYPNKQMTTGEGGLVVTRDRAVDECIRCLRNQGRGPGEMEFVAEGFNFRLTELQAALGRAQLARLDEFLERREQLAAHYRARLAPVSGLVTLGDPAPGDRRSWFVFPVFLADPAWRGPVRGLLARAGIQTAPYFPAIHHQAPYSDPALRGGAALSVTEAAAARGFAIPFHAGLTPAQADEVVAVLAEALAPRARDGIPADLPTLLGAPA